MFDCSFGKNFEQLIDLFQGSGLVEAYAEGFDGRYNAIEWRSMARF
jgi:hypothetical protein